MYVCDLLGPKLQLKNHNCLKGWPQVREILKGILSTRSQCLGPHFTPSYESLSSK